MANYKPLTDVRYLVVHCADTPADMDIGVKEIDMWHRQQGWLMVGYHKVIRRDGTVENGRKLDQPGAHVKNFNSQSLGVCLVGGAKRDGKKLLPENNFTPAQFASLKVVLREFVELHPIATICGHRDLDSGKACPSFDAETWAEENGLNDRP